MALFSSTSAFSRRRCLPAVSALLASAGPLSAIPAFPGAEGYGANALGGRGGDVYHVTNLNASGAGSFAQGIATVPTAGRTIVFDVSGYIRLPSGSSGTRMTASKITIAGQTAPGDGVGFYNNFFRISGDDVVIRHLRFRQGKYGSGGDCIDLDSGCLNAILDHVSMQFSTDENMSSFGSPPENLTLQYSLNAWGLESHSCGGLWDQNHATSHHNLWAHNHTRNPKSRPNGLLEWVNNVTYDWDIGFIMGDTTSVQSYKANVLNNYFVCPPGNTQSKAMVKGTVATNGMPNFTVFLSGNLTDNNGDGVLNGTDKGYSIVEGTAYAPGTTGLTSGATGYYQAAAAIAGSTVGVTTDTPLTAYKKVVSNAGALRLDANFTGAIRDEVDTILFNKLTTQTRGHVTRESDTGASAAGFGVLASTAAPADTDQDGMPDYYETALGWNAAVQDHNTALANSGGLITGTTFFPTNTVAGYTRLEEYLQFLAVPHATVAKNITGTPTSLTVDLRKFTSGFATTPLFAVSAIANGTVTQYLADGVTVSATGPIARFTPTLNYVGRGRFDFTVTDAAGSSWTQTLAVLVSQSGLPRDLNWKGDGSGNVWDSSTNNWLRNAAATAFSFGDRVAFDDSGSKTPAVTVAGTVSPTTVNVDSSGSYTFGGTGSITASGTLTKRGSGTLTINNSGTNSFSGAILDEGAVSLGSVTAIASGLGTGQLTMNNGTVNFYDPGAGGSFTSTLPNPLAINGNVSMNTGARCGTSGALSGAGTLDLYIPYIRTDWGGNPSAFTGTINVITDADGCEFRINSGGTGAVTDYGNSRIRLADKVNTYFLPNPPSTGDKTQIIQVGELSTTGTGSGVFLGGANGAADRIVHWKIGALNTSSTFGGAIVNRTGPAALTKIGSGALTLTGASTHTGATNVNAGALIVAGSLGNTPVGVASGALLAGGGTFAGSVTAAAGAFVSPGTAPFTGATMTLNGGLTLNGSTLYFDMSNTPAGANDKIAMGGGALTMAGTQFFQFLLLQNTLAAGTYDLITGATSISASGYTLTHNLPTGTRQTFSLAPVGTTLRLTVSGDPATLTWTGTTSGNWDTTTTGNWTGAVPNTFGSNDAVVIDDSSSVLTITPVGTVAPRSTLVNNSTKAFTLGAGLGGGVLSKNGTNQLTLTGANSHSATILNAGTIQLANATANASGLGTGPITLNGGNLKMYSAGDAAYAGNLPNALIVSGTAGFNTAPRGGFSGNVSGAGTLNYLTTYVRADVSGNWSDFSGILNVITDAGGGDYRIISNYSWAGLPNATVNLATKTWFRFDGILNSGAGTTIPIGALNGPTGAHLLGGLTGGRALTYRIGGKNTDATFAGDISEQNTGTATNYVKTGTGVWTLSGFGSWNGGTTVEQGTLKLSGPYSCSGATYVEAGATLQLANGSLATDAVNIAAGATLTGNGTLTGDLNNDGTVTSILGGTLAVTGDVVNNGTMRIASGTALSASGNFVNNGVLDLLTASQGLPPNLQNNGIVIDSSTLRIASVSKVGNVVTLKVPTHSAHTYQLQRSTSLTGAWTDLGASQSGLTTVSGAPTERAFTDSGATFSKCFYRIRVTP